MKKFKVSPKLVTASTKRPIKASRDCYDDEIEYRNGSEDTTTLGYAVMALVESLPIFDDDNATQEELSTAVLDKMNKYYILTPEQQRYIKEDFIRSAST